MTETTTTDVHVLRGTRYLGCWQDPTIRPAGEVPEVRGDAAGWLAVTDARGTMALARPEDLFDTEAEARAEAKARRQPRRPRQARPLYGDYAQLAAFVGIATDGSGRRNR